MKKTHHVQLQWQSLYVGLNTFLWKPMIQFLCDPHVRPCYQASGLTMRQELQNRRAVAKAKTALESLPLHTVVYSSTVTVGINMNQREMVHYTGKNIKIMTWIICCIDHVLLFFSCWNQRKMVHYREKEKHDINFSTLK